MSAQIAGLVFHPRHKPDTWVAKLAITETTISVECSASNTLILLTGFELTPEGLERLWEALKWIESMTPATADAIPTDGQWVIDTSNNPSDIVATRCNKIAYAFRNEFRCALDCLPWFRPSLLIA